MENQKQEWKSGADLAEQGFEYIQQWLSKGIDPSVIKTDFEGLDNILSGFQRGNMVILGGRPAMGKTALMQNIILNVAQQGHSVGVFSLSDSAEQFMLRLLAIKSSVSMTAIRNGRINNETEIPKVMKACEDTHSLPIFVQDRPASVNDIRERANQLQQQQNNLALIVVDYIGLLYTTDARLSLSESLAEASRKLKILAKELDVCVLVISQLNRSLEHRPDKRPILSDLRGTGALEQDADVICFLYRDEYYNIETPDQGLAELIVAKQRNGPVGTVILKFEGEYLQFSSPDHM